MYKQIVENVLKNPEIEAAISDWTPDTFNQLDRLMESEANKHPKPKYIRCLVGFLKKHTSLNGKNLVLTPATVWSNGLELLVLHAFEPHIVMTDDDVLSAIFRTVSSLDLRSPALNVTIDFNKMIVAYLKPQVVDLPLKEAINKLSTLLKEKYRLDIDLSYTPTRLTLNGEEIPLENF